MLEDKILSDYKGAMKSRDQLKSSVLSFLRAEFMNTAITKKKNKLDDAEIIAVIRKQIKQHQDSIEQFSKGNRRELADKEKKELEVLKSYLPPELPAEELRKLIDETAAAINAMDMKDMGRLMKEVGAKVSGKADPKLVSDLVKAKLSAGQFDQP